jgi:hypothetical protein
MLPVANVASGLSSQATAAATSSAEAMRPIGCLAANPAVVAPVSAIRRRIHGVSTVPGRTALTRIPSVVWSSALTRVSATTPPL